MNEQNPQTNQQDSSQSKLQLAVEVRSSPRGWKADAAEEFRRTGKWTAWVGFGPKTSYRDPDDYEHPYLK